MAVGQKVWLKLNQNCGSDLGVKLEWLLVSLVDQSRLKIGLCSFLELLPLSNKLLHVLLLSSIQPAPQSLQQCRLAGILPPVRHSPASRPQDDQTYGKESVNASQGNTWTKSLTGQVHYQRKFSFYSMTVYCTGNYLLFACHPPADPRPSSP